MVVTTLFCWTLRKSGAIRRDGRATARTAAAGMSLCWAAPTGANGGMQPTGEKRQREEKWEKNGVGYLHTVRSGESVSSRSPTQPLRPPNHQETTSPVSWSHSASHPMHWQLPVRFPCNVATVTGSPSWCVS